jgi:hypothetical protein
MNRNERGASGIRPLTLGAVLEFSFAFYAAKKERICSPARQVTLVPRKT